MTNEAAKKGSVEKKEWAECGLLPSSGQTDPSQAFIQELLELSGMFWMFVSILFSSQL